MERLMLGNRTESDFDPVEDKGLIVSYKDFFMEHDSNSIVKDVIDGDVLQNMDRNGMTFFEAGDYFGIRLARYGAITY